MNKTRNETAHPLARALRVTAAFAALWAVLAPGAASGQPAPAKEQTPARAEVGKAGTGAMGSGRGSSTSPFISKFFVTPGTHVGPNDTVFYGIEFSEPVTGLDITDLRRSTSGLENPEIVRIFTIDGGVTYSVEVTLGALGSGLTLGQYTLSIVDDDSIIGGFSGESLGGPGTGDETFGPTVFVSNDCNNNGIPDAQEIANGEPDCNKNGIPDTCDIAGFMPDASYGPTPYLQRSDSPFPLTGLGSTAYLEDFEDGSFNVPGVTANGTVTGPGGLTDSVDGDDGSIDGSGTNGRSFFFGNGSAGIFFLFNPDAFGRLPQYAGVVWTDGGFGDTVTFDAFDGSGAPIGTFGPHNADGSNSGTTAEDRFYGIVHADGIGSIRVRNASGGIEVDHLQYGVFAGASDQNQNGVPDECEVGGGPTLRPFPFDDQSATNLPASIDPVFETRLGAADLNSDGLTDFYTTGADGPVFNIRNDQTKLLYRLVQPSAPGVAFDMAAGDFNSDGRIDLVSANASSPFGLIAIRNISNDGPSFDFFPATPGLAATVRRLAVIDANQDGRPDLIGLMQNGDIVRFINSSSQGGSITFTAQTLFTNPFGSTPPSPAFDLAVGDFDRDGHDDFAAVYGGLVVVRGFGNGAFSVSSTDLTDRYTAVAAARLRDASFPKLVLGLRDGGGETFFPFDFSSRSAPSFSSGTPRSIVIGDIDADGHDDIAVIDTEGAVSWHKDGGFGSFTSRSVLSPDGANLAVALADFDTDGDLDLAVVRTESLLSRDGTVPHEAALTKPQVSQLEAGRPLGDSATFIRAIPNRMLHRRPDFYSINGIVTTGDAPVAAVVADINNDGKDDIVTATFFDDTIAWSTEEQYDPAGWTKHVIINTASSVRPDGPVSLAVADIDRDGDIDVVAAGIINGVVMWFENQSHGEVWVPHMVDQTAPGASCVAAADFDNNGRMDIVAGLATAGQIRLYRNFLSTIPVFTRETVSSSGLASIRALAAGDLDHDGLQDIVACVYNSNQIIALVQELARGDPDRPSAGLSDERGILPLDFFPTTPISRSTPTSVALADFNNDGFLDIASTSFNEGSVRVHLAVEPLFYPESMTVINTVSGASSVIAVDLDRDGDMDLAATGRTGTGFSRATNRGRGSEWQEESFFTFTETPTACAAGDFDDDGLPDVAVGSFDNDRFTWSANYGAALYAYMVGTAGAIFEGGSTSIADVYGENQAADGDPAISYRRFSAYIYDRGFTNNGPQPRLLTTEEINALISRFEVFADSDGNGSFSVEDASLGFRDGPFTFDQFGTLSFNLSAGVIGNSISPGENRRFFVVARAKSNASSANPNTFSALVEVSDKTFEDSVFQEGVQPRFPGFYQTGTITIAPDFRPRCPSDIDANGITDTPDLVVLIGSFGKTVMPFTDGDLTGDGRVTTPDLVKLLSNFGHTCN